MSRLFERFRGGTYRQFAPPSPDEHAAVVGWSQDLGEAKSEMMAEMGAHWVAGPDIRGLNLDYVRGKHEIRPPSDP